MEPTIVNGILLAPFAFGSVPLLPERKKRDTDIEPQCEHSLKKQSSPNRTMFLYYLLYFGGSLTHTVIEPPGAFSWGAPTETNQRDESAV